MTSNTSIYHDMDDLELRRDKLDREIKEFHKKFYDNLLKKVKR